MDSLFKVNFGNAKLLPWLFFKVAIGFFLSLFEFIYMNRVFSSFALRRSGHHAVTYWIYGHFKCSKFMNDKKVGVDITNGTNMKENVFLTFEDQDIKFPSVKSLCSFNETQILTIRDPFNLFASRLAHPTLCRWGPSLKEMKPLWKDHAKEYLNLTTIKIAINYNKWVVSDVYRDEISLSLEGVKTPSRIILEYVPEFGWGSSFDHKKYARQASKMRLFERWKHFQGNSKYACLFDEELIDLSKSIFGKKFTYDIVHSLKIK